MSTQTENFLTKEMEIETFKSNLINFCIGKMKELDYKGLNECQYLEMKAKIDTLEDVINEIKNN